MQGEQTDAVRHLFPDAVLPQQKRQRVFVGTFSQQGEPFPSLLSRAALRHAEDIFVPVAKTQPFKAVRPAFQNRFRRREGVNGCIRQRGRRDVRKGVYGNFFSISFTERLQAPADPGDVVVLGNEKADDGLPQILPKDPDAAAAADGGSEEGIPRIYRPPDRFIIPVQIKIAVPEVRKFFFRAGKRYPHPAFCFRLLPDEDGMASRCGEEGFACGGGKAAVPEQGADAEHLPGIHDGPYIKICQNSFVHRNFHFLRHHRKQIRGAGQCHESRMMHGYRGARSG